MPSTSAADCGAFQGVEMLDIFRQFIDAEFRSDWAKAKLDHGDKTSVAHLQRTAGQRRFDALFAIFQRGASTEPGGTTPQVITNIVMDWDTYQRELARLGGEDPGAANPMDEAYRCSSFDGDPLEPTEAAVSALSGHVRRAVIGADGVVINLGRKQRLFSGSAELAVRLSGTDCYWFGCDMPASQCQIDHLIPWADHGGGERGETRPDNGGLGCTRHNRIKEQGFRVWRDQLGEWHIVRPDGTEVE
jgi:hypothetical protein